MAMNVLKERTIKVSPSNKYKIGDPSYFKEIEAGSDNKNLKKLTFDGCISWAPLAKMRIRLMGNPYESNYKVIEITIAQSGNQDEIEYYLKHEYLPEYVASKYQLGCDTAEFRFVTKYGSDLFRIGSDGYYGDLLKMKRQHGMLLIITFDAALFDFDDVYDRMMKLFPEPEIINLKNFVFERTD